MYVSAQKEDWMSTVEGSGSTPDQGGTSGVAREQASKVAGSAGSAAGQIAQTSAEQAKQVVGEAKSQARNLVGEARGQVSEQVTTQRDRLVTGLQSVGQEIEQMAAGGGGSGPATDLARQLAERVRSSASYLESRQPADLLEDVRSFARRRSGAFLVSAALAGVAAGRLTRGAKAAHSSAPSGPTYTPTRDAYASTSYPAGTVYETGTVTEPSYGSVDDLSVAPDTGTAGVGYAEPLTRPDELGDAGAGRSGLAP